MSRLGKQTIEIPSGVEVNFADGSLSVKGPKGTLNRSFRREINIEVKEGGINISPAKKDDILTRALWGTYASHILNMLTGVTVGFEKKLVLEGIGFRVTLEGNTLILSVGFSHQVKIEIPDGIKVEVEKNNITVIGIDKETVGTFAAKIRSTKKPEPYKGKGIRYEDEVVKKKQGKKVVA